MPSPRQDPCQNCGFAIPRPSGSACHADPCPNCGYPRPLGDCSDLTVGAPAPEDAPRSDAGQGQT